MEIEKLENYNLVNETLNFENSEIIDVDDIEILDNIDMTNNNVIEELEYNGLFENLFAGIEAFSENYTDSSDYTVNELSLYGEMLDPDRLVSVENNFITIIYSYYADMVFRTIIIKENTDMHVLGPYIGLDYMVVVGKYGEPYSHSFNRDIQYYDESQTLWIIFHYENWRIHRIQITELWS